MVGNYSAQAMKRTGVTIDLPLLDTFDFNLTEEELKLLRWYVFAGNFTQPELDWSTAVHVRDQLVEKGLIDYNEQRYEITNLGLIPSGNLPLPVFALEQDRLIRQRYTLLKTAVTAAGGGESLQLAVENLTLYRAQWQRALSKTLFFLEIQYRNGHLYRVGTTDRSVDEFATRLARDLRPLLGQTPQVNVLYALAHQGIIEHYVAHRCSNQDKSIAVAGCLLLEFSNGIISELKELGDRNLGEEEIEILEGRWSISGTENTVTVKVEGSTQRSGHERTVELKEYHIICKQCGKDVSLWRYPGRPPTLCSDECEREYQRERDREKTRERVRRYRARQKKKNGEN